MYTKTNFKIYTNNYTTMKDTNTMNLAPEVTNALNKYNTAIEWALAAAQKLESISITSHLAELFWVDEKQTADAITQDYLQAA